MCIRIAARGADLFVSIGTSGAVYPAAGFVQSARYCGAHCVEMNLEPSQGSLFFHESRIGPAGDLVPAWVIWVIVADKDEATHVRLSGPAPSVDKHAAAFEKWVKSLK